MREPTELGSIIRDAEGYLWVLADSVPCKWFSPARGEWRRWDEIDALEPIHRGWTRPKPEPTNEWATIRTVAGLHWQRRADGCWYSVGLGPVRKAWGLIPGISEGWVLVFAGVPDA
jgi:hypothetical protein